MHANQCAPSVYRLPSGCVSMLLPMYAEASNTRMTSSLGALSRKRWFVITSKYLTYLAEEASNYPLRTKGKQQRTHVHTQGVAYGLGGTFGHTSTVLSTVFFCVFFSLSWIDMLTRGRLLSTHALIRAAKRWQDARWTT